MSHLYIDNVFTTFLFVTCYARDGKNDQLQFESSTVSSVILVHYAVTSACFW